MLKSVLLLSFFAFLVGCDIIAAPAVKAPCASYILQIDSVVDRDAYITLVPTCSSAVPIKCIQYRDHFGQGDTAVGVEIRDLGVPSFSGYAVWDTLKRCRK